MTTLGQGTNILDDFESGIAEWTTFGTAIFQNGIQSTGDASSGLNAMSVLQFIGFYNTDGQFGGVQNSNLSITNWSTYDQLSVAVKSDAATDKSGIVAELGFVEASGQSWGMRTPITITTSYQNVSADLVANIPTGFEITEHEVLPPTTNFVMELENITRVNVIFKRIAPRDPAVFTVNHFIDDLALISNPMPTTLSLNSSSLDFGRLAPSPAKFRFNSPKVTCSYFTEEPAWHINVVTTNSLNKPALVSNGGDFILLKFQTANFGGGSNPNPNDEASWAGFFKFVSDGTFDSILASPTIQSPNSDDLDLTFAVDAWGAAQTTYQGAVTFEFVIE
ncbi:MAG: hypothetical protein GKR87_16740 [Kiritimatiellae bacterium]|nr:hypothetical protein [Kiritimatiellia bacterium]NKB22807.1 hypothetical protein [Kiritimatiellia bacterium]NKB25963.1 hypothetical protein [Kiritimatiellia bacterium]NKB25972.1 hypothetical protein [Kiritimatiellia bacterium]NKB25981.1 hypothetical protein [Kiritimatiellia bacterium]